MARQGRSRHVFTPEEDARMIRLIAEHGTSNWSFIAEAMGNRVPRQCRERWKSSLSPGHTNPAWTEAEDRRLADLYAVHGPRWALITTFFPGRSDYNIKNRWRRFKRIGAEPDAGAPAPAALPPPPRYENPHPQLGLEVEAFDWSLGVATWSFDDK